MNLAELARFIDTKVNYTFVQFKFERPRNVIILICSDIFDLASFQINNIKKQTNRTPMSSKQAKGPAAPKKHTYAEMIQVALLTLNEAGGSTR